MVDQTTHPNAYNVKLPDWDGPLHLLLDLIRASKIKIQNISIKQITQDYLDAIKAMKDLDMNLGAEFMAMASHLLYIKSRMLLPEEFTSQDDIEDPKKDLIDKLLNYQKYKQAADKLSEISGDELTFLETAKSKKSSKKIAQESDWEELSVLDLMKAFSKIMETVNSPPPIFSDQEFKSEDKIKDIRKELKALQKIKFENLFKGKRIYKQEIIITFWAVLEMFKQNEIEVLQNKIFGDIFIFPYKKAPQ